MLIFLVSNIFCSKKNNEVNEPSSSKRQEKTLEEFYFNDCTAMKDSQSIEQPISTICSRKTYNDNQMPVLRPEYECKTTEDCLSDKYSDISDNSDFHGDLPDNQMPVLRPEYECKTTEDCLGDKYSDISDNSDFHGDLPDNQISSHKNIPSCVEYDKNTPPCVSSDKDKSESVGDQIASWKLRISRFEMNQPYEDDKSSPGMINKGKDSKVYEISTNKNVYKEQKAVQKNDSSSNNDSLRDDDLSDNNELILFDKIGFLLTGIENISEMIGTEEYNNILKNNFLIFYSHCLLNRIIVIDQIIENFKFIKDLQMRILSKTVQSVEKNCPKKQGEKHINNEEFIFKKPRIDEKKSQSTSVGCNVYQNISFNRNAQLSTTNELSSTSQNPNLYSIIE
ncbi:hypothetical protein DMUE_3857 [Dictyocoela muelleri]|nr:hypothetical protein DMUE_3857 [Dictyocoela muelleri]